ncbi:MAG: relaxase MobL [Ruminococcus sp.]
MRGRVNQRGCPKYVGYLSFDNKFLVDNGLMIGEVLDRAKLMDIARKGISSLITTKATS